MTKLLKMAEQRAGLSASKFTTNFQYIHIHVKVLDKISET